MNKMKVFLFLLLSVFFLTTLSGNTSLFSNETLIAYGGGGGIGSSGSSGIEHGSTGFFRPHSSSKSSGIASSAHSVSGKTRIDPNALKAQENTNGTTNNTSSQQQQSGTS